MSVVRLSSRTLPDTEIEQVAQLAVTLSRRLTRAQIDDIAPSIADALESVAMATHVESCQLVEFSGSGSVARTHVRASVVNRSDGQSRTPLPEKWVTERLARGELVVISRPDELPREAIAAREGRTGTSSILGVPASVGGQVTCALVIDSARSPRRWLPALVERVQLLSEIFASALQRPSHAKRSAIPPGRHRAAQHPARGGQRVPERGDQELPRFRRHRRRQRVAPTRLDACRPGGANDLERPAAGRDRHRQGIVRAGVARSKPAACAPARAGQLRGAAADAGRERAVRPRKRGVHRCRRDAPGTIRAGRRRHDLPGRDRRPVARDSGEVSPRAAGG